MINQVVGQYKIIEKLGEGGMGAVYKGIDLMVEREVAIKMLRPEIARQPELVERFRTEAVTLAKLNNPGIATLYNFFRQGDDFFMVMEFVSGQTLDAILRQGGPMPWDRAVPMFCRILEAIQPAHQAGILHRDIKPANIMLTNWGSVKVMDFGIARVLGAARMTREGRMVGTIEYISPERIRGEEADVRSDIYSLGVVLYEMLSGHLPFESTSEFEIMKGHVQEPPPPFTKYGAPVPPPIEAAVMQSLAKALEFRFQSCADFLNALEQAARQSPGRIPSRQTDQNLKPTMLSMGGAEQSQSSWGRMPAANTPSEGMGAVRPSGETPQMGAGESKATRFEPMSPPTNYTPSSQNYPQPATPQNPSGTWNPQQNPSGFWAPAQQQNPSGTWQPAQQQNPSGTWQPAQQQNPSGTWQPAQQQNPSGTWQPAQQNPSGTWQQAQQQGGYTQQQGPPAPTKPLNWKLLAGGGAALVLLIAAGIFALRPKSEAPPVQTTQPVTQTQAPITQPPPAVPRNVQPAELNIPLSKEAQAVVDATSKRDEAAPVITSFGDSEKDSAARELKKKQDAQRKRAAALKALDDQ